MKKIKYLVFIALCSIMLVPKVGAIPTASSNVDYRACIAFADTFTAITSEAGQYYFKSCFKAACQSGHYAKLQMVQNAGYRCLNGNYDPYIKLTSDGCANYNGTCSSSAGYCETVELIDCNKTSSGAAYSGAVKPTTRVVPTTKTPVKTTAKPTTKRTTTAKKNVSTVPKTFTNGTTTTAVSTVPVPEETTTTTTQPVITADIKSITVMGKKVKLKSGKKEYTIGIQEGITEVDVNVELSTPSESTFIEVTGNTEIPEEGGEIKVKVVTEAGEVNEVLLKVERTSNKSNDCTLVNIHMEDYNIGFNKNTYEYKLKLPKNAASLDMEVVPNDSEHATYEVKGNEHLRNNSKVVIEVRAEDGTICSYAIKIRKPSNTWKYILLIVLLSGALITSSVFLYKYLKKSKGKYKYE